MAERPDPRKLTDYTTYADAQRRGDAAALWRLFDGTPERLNIAHECVDRHAATGRVAVRVAHADGRDETLTLRSCRRRRRASRAGWRRRA